MLYLEVHKVQDVYITCPDSTQSFGLIMFKYQKVMIPYNKENLLIGDGGVFVEY